LRVGFYHFRRVVVSEKVKQCALRYDGWVSKKTPSISTLRLRSVERSEVERCAVAEVEYVAASTPIPHLSTTRADCLWPLHEYQARSARDACANTINTTLERFVKLPNFDCSCAHLPKFHFVTLLFLQTPSASSLHHSSAPARDRSTPRAVAMQPLWRCFAVPAPCRS